MAKVDTHTDNIDDGGNEDDDNDDDDDAHGSNICRPDPDGGGDGDALRYRHCRDHSCRKLRLPVGINNIILIISIILISNILILIIIFLLLKELCLD